MTCWAPFTLYVIDRALRVAADVAAHGMDVPIAVNLSAHNLLDQHLPNAVAELLRQHDVGPERLVLEITETVVMSDQEVIDEVLAALRAMGIRIALDDFGTGYSSLAFLARVPVDEVKVDRSFVMRMADSPQAAAIVRFTINLGQELGASGGGRGRGDRRPAGGPGEPRVCGGPGLPLLQADAGATRSSPF